MDEKVRDIQLIRLDEAGIVLTPAGEVSYLKAPDTLEAASTKIPVGYKTCGKCKEPKKLYLFNRNKDSKLNVTGNCKDCQKNTAKASYGRNKHKRDYKKYYEANREAKREQGRKYYAENKEAVTAKQKEYRQSSKGRKVMNKAHSKRKKALKENVGIPWTREMVVERDSAGHEFPICVLCNLPIKDPKEMHMEHLIPIVMGGLNCFTNVGCAHDLCNLQKSKDGREVTTEQVDSLRTRAEEYIDANSSKFVALEEDKE